MLKIKNLFQKWYGLFFPEERLVELLCALVVIKIKGLSKELNLMATKQNIDWNKFLNIIERNKLESFLQSSIKKVGLLERMSSKQRRNFQKRVLLTEFRLKKHYVDSKMILELFNRSSVRFVVMKTYLIIKIIKELAEGKSSRCHEDLDILIPVAEFEKASKILFQSGYDYITDHNIKKSGGFVPWIQFYLPKTQESFIKRKHIVELHTKVVDDFDFLPSPVITAQENSEITQILFDNSVLVKSNGVEVKVFPPTELFFSLFLHLLIQHNLQGGHSYYEAAQLTRKFKKEIDWTSITNLVKRYNLEGFYYWFLALLNDLYPRLLPLVVISKVNKYEDSLRTTQWLLYYYYRYKVLHPSNFLKIAERQKEWCWAIISGNLTKLIFLKMKRRVHRFLDTSWV